MSAPIKLCECGCGEPTPIAKNTSTERGWRAGEQLRFVHNHHRRKSPTRYVIDDETGCWLWQRALVTDGYGSVGIGNRKTKKAHVLYYEQRNGPVPEGRELHHRCGNRACVNPEHLEPLTRLEHRRRHPRSKVAT